MEPQHRASVAQAGPGGQGSGRELRSHLPVAAPRGEPAPGGPLLLRLG